MPLPSPPGAPKSLLPQPCVLVIFGGDGDLAWRKLLPAVYNLNKDGDLPSHFAVVCFGVTWAVTLISLPGNCCLSASSSRAR